jgi:hypothetical protein
MRDCISCYNYNKPSCPFADLDNLHRLKSRIYIVECWCDEDDVEMCDNMGCGIEEDME